MGRGNFEKDVIDDDFLKIEEGCFMTKEDRYIRKRLRRARRQAREFYACRKYPIDRHKVVFCNIEGTVGYGCNPKYICEELCRRNAVRREKGKQPYDLVWLVDDTSLPFPPDVRVVKNTLRNRAYELSTAADSVLFRTLRAVLRSTTTFLRWVSTASRPTESRGPK